MQVSQQALAILDVNLKQLSKKFGCYATVKTAVLYKPLPQYLAILALAQTSIFKYNLDVQHQVGI